ncbi:MAG: PIN domain-containing protein [Blastochloris sp.]|nr:PIN domain-containing protein [Blastochloris sp.]
MTNAPPVFIDTNVWVYAFQATQDPAKTARAKALIRSESSIAISTQIVSEISVTLLRKFGATEPTIRRLTWSLYRKYAVYDYTSATYRAASYIRETYMLSFWDSTIVASALEHGLTTLYSEDLQDGLRVNDQLTIQNPFR